MKPSFGPSAEPNSFRVFIVFVVPQFIHLRNHEKQRNIPKSSSTDFVDFTDDFNPGSMQSVKIYNLWINPFVNKHHVVKESRVAPTECSRAHQVV